MATYNINVLCDNKAVNTAEFDIKSTVCKLMGQKLWKRLPGMNF